MHSRWTISLLAAVLVGMPTLAKAEKANQFEYFLAQQPKIERTVVDGLEITNIVIDQSKSNSTSSAPNKKNAVVKSAPKDGNEGTYPLAGLKMVPRALILQLKQNLAAMFLQITSLL